MAEPKENVLMEKITSLCKRRGFIFQSSEIYGGIQGFWDYGPLGAELKRNVKEAWWTTMTRLRDDVVGLEATIIMHPKIWEASGHVATFADPMSTCRQCKKLVRSDQIWDMIPENAWAQAIAELCPGGLVESPRLFAWAKGKGKHIAPNLALVRNPEVTLSFLAERVNEPGASPLTTKELYQYLATDQFNATGLMNPCPHCGGELTPPRPFNLMFKSHYGPVESDENVCYLRPETAQAIFAQFKNVHETSRQKVPFGIAQMGKAFRNEVTPRNYTFRSREFEQMELEFFIKPDEAVEAITGVVARVADLPSAIGDPQPNWGWEVWHKYWVEERIKFYEGIGLPRTTLEEYWQKPEELAHYARACVDILFKFPFGTQELEGIAARSDFDLSQHERCSGKAMGVFDEELRTAFGKLPPEKQTELKDRYYAARLKYLTKMGVPAAEAGAAAQEDADGLAKGQYIPHVIEPSAGVDRLILALIANAYTETTKTDDKGKSETIYVMKFHPRIAPIKVAVLPLLKNKPDLAAKARAIFESLRPHMMAFHDETGSIGKRYARQDEAGTPFCVTVDFETFEGVKEGPMAGQKDTVTLRHRDDGRQERLPVGELLPWLLARVR
jgi:glycyl-tRNA synthetase